MDNNKRTAPCPRCGRKLRFGPEALGRKARCLSCHQRLAVMKNGRIYAIEESGAQPGGDRIHEDTPVSSETPTITAPRWGLSRAEQLAVLTVAVICVALLLRSPTRPQATAAEAMELSVASQPAPVDPPPGILQRHAEIRPDPTASPKPVVVSWEPDPQPDTEKPTTSAPSGAQSTAKPKRTQPSDLLRRGLMHCHEGRYSEGLYCFQQLVALNPGDAQAQYYCGRALHSLGRHADAVMAYDRSLRLDPNCSTARACRVTALDALRVTAN
jgi:hypothetical protein